MVFFFQAEDGIRDFHVTGVQTCALPIYPTGMSDTEPMRSEGPAVTVHGRGGERRVLVLDPAGASKHDELPRSEERRVGKERRARWSKDMYQKNVSFCEKVKYK